MATKSILKNVDVRDVNLGRNLIHALENAMNKKSEEVVLSKAYTELTRDQISKIFGKTK